MQPHLLLWRWEANSGFNDSNTPGPVEDTDNNTPELHEDTDNNTPGRLEDTDNRTPGPREDTDNSTPGPLETYILNLHKRQRSVSEESDTDSDLGPSPKKKQRLASPEVLTITPATTVAECDPNPLKRQHSDNEESAIDHTPKKRQRMSIEFLLNKTTSKQQRIGHVKVAPRDITPEPEQSNTTALFTFEAYPPRNLFAPEVYPPGYVPYPDPEPKFVPITQEDCKSEPDDEVHFRDDDELCPPGYNPFTATYDSDPFVDELAQNNHNSVPDSPDGGLSTFTFRCPWGQAQTQADTNADPIDEDDQTMDGMSDYSGSDASEIPPEWFLNNILMGNYDQLPSSELQQAQTQAEANEDPTDQDEQAPDNMSDYSGSDVSEIPPEWFLNDVLRMGAVYAQVAAQYEQQSAAESAPLTQAQCQAEPEDAETRRSRAFASLPTRDTPWDLSARPEQHPDSDLAIDELWARFDDKFGPTFWPNADFLDAKLDGLTSLTIDYLNPVSPPKEPVDVTLDDGSTLTLHPHYPAYERSYYDDLTYGDQDPKEGYRFTSVAEILEGFPKNYNGIGWSPEHYAGLTNTIPVPATAYTKPRQKNSESAPIRKSLLHSDHDLAYYVGLARRPLRVMYQQGTGLVHPSFPTTWGHVALLTEDQLDSIAEFYHQTGNEDWKTASRWWAQYPCPVQWKTNEDNVWVKRRKMKNFIGIRQPELPPVEVCQMLKDLEDEVQRKIDAKREGERRIDDMYAKMYLTGGGVI